MRQRRVSVSVHPSGCWHVPPDFTTPSPPPPCLKLAQKPANILLSKREPLVVKLADFGLTGTTFQGGWLSGGLRRLTPGSCVAHD